MARDPCYHHIDSQPWPKIGGSLCLLLRFPLSLRHKPTAQTRDELADSQAELPCVIAKPRSIKLSAQCSTNRHRFGAAGVTFPLPTQSLFKFEISSPSGLVLRTFFANYIRLPFLIRDIPGILVCFKLLLIVAQHCGVSRSTGQIPTSKKITSNDAFLFCATHEKLVKCLCKTGDTLHDPC